VSWGKGTALPLYGDRVHVHPRKHARFDAGIWEIWTSEVVDGMRHYELVPWPHNRLSWPFEARKYIWAYLHDLIKLSVLDQMMCALEEEELKATNA